MCPNIPLQDEPLDDAPDAETVRVEVDETEDWTDWIKRQPPLQQFGQIAGIEELADSG